jgi:hypothetical protein
VPATAKFEDWLGEVREALNSINMPMDDWQKSWAFDFKREYEAGVNPDQAAQRANRFWWLRQNAAIKQDCRVVPNCWLPRGHQGECQPTVTGMGKYKKGDHVKIEVADKKFGGVGEWMWMLVEHSDDEQQLVFGRLDNEPIANPDMELGQQLAVSYDKIRDHRRFA